MSPPHPPHTDKVLVNLVPLCALQMAKAVMLPHLQQRHQATTVILRGGWRHVLLVGHLHGRCCQILPTDELCEGVRIGGECSVIGIPIPELLESSPHAQIATVVEVSPSYWITTLQSYQRTTLSCPSRPTTCSSRTEDLRVRGACHTPCWRSTRVRNN